MEEEDHGSFEEQDSSASERNDDFGGGYGEGPGYGDFDGGNQRFPGPRGPRGGFGMRGPRYASVFFISAESHICQNMFLKLRTDALVQMPTLS